MQTCRYCCVLKVYMQACQRRFNSKQRFCISYSEVCRAPLYYFHVCSADAIPSNWLPCSVYFPLWKSSAAWHVITVVYISKLANLFTYRTYYCYSTNRSVSRIVVIMICLTFPAAAMDQIPPVNFVHVAVSACLHKSYRLLACPAGVTADWTVSFLVKDK